MGGTPGCLLGSPPHGRGAQVSVAGVVHLDRLTPAWAGSTNSRNIWLKTSRAHPRMGGEHVSALKAGVKG